MKQFDQNACASVKVFEKYFLGDGFCSINKSMAPIKFLDMTFEKDLFCVFTFTASFFCFGCGSGNIQ